MPTAAIGVALPRFAHLNLGNALVALDRSDEALGDYRTTCQHGVPEDLPSKLQDLEWLATVYPELPRATCRQALVPSTPESLRG